MLLVQILTTLLFPAYGQRNLKWPWTQARVRYEIRISPNKTCINLASVIMHGNEVYLNNDWIWVVENRQRLNVSEKFWMQTDDGKHQKLPHPKHSIVEIAQHSGNLPTKVSKVRPFELSQIAVGCNQNLPLMGTPDSRFPKDSMIIC